MDMKQMKPNNTTNYNKSYDSMIYNSGPVKFSDIVSNKYNILHKKLYEDALSKLINDIYDKDPYLFNSVDEFIKHTRILELKNNEYWMPSSVIIIIRSNKFIKNTYSLEKYWNTSLNKKNANINDLKITDHKIIDFKLNSINYVSGKAELESQMDDIKIDADFKYLNEDTDISEDYLLRDTFTYKYNKLHE